MRDQSASNSARTQVRNRRPRIKRILRSSGIRFDLETATIATTLEWISADNFCARPRHRGFSYGKSHNAVAIGSARQEQTAHARRTYYQQLLGFWLTGLICRSRSRHYQAFRRCLSLDHLN
jgi:hypothetical protein